MKSARILCAGLTLLLAFPDSARAEPPRTDGEREVTLVPGQLNDLNFSYRVKCAGARDGSLRAVQGYVTVGGISRRFELHEYTGSLSLFLGRVADSDKTVKVKFEKSDRCRIEKLDITPKAYSEDALDKASVDEVLADSKLLDVLARRHAPVIIIRPDQFKNRETDLPLNLSVGALRHAPRGTTTLFFTQTWSDEDSKTKADDTDAQMGRYGRTTDIEKVWQIELDDKNLQPVAKPKFHGGIIKGTGIGHRFWEFEGEYVGESQNPILYNISNHNVLSDSSKHIAGDKVGSSHAPSPYVPAPEARESIIVPHPWMMEVSSDELQREKKLKRRQDEYLYVRLRLRDEKSTNLGLRHSLTGEITLPDGSKAAAGGTLDRFGEDAYNLESFIAIPAGADRESALEALRAIGRQTGLTVGFKKQGAPVVELDGHATRFYRYAPNANGGMIFEEITGAFDLEPGTSGADSRYRVR